MVNVHMTPTPVPLNLPASTYTGNDPTWVMRARARNAQRFQMYMASSLRVDEADPHLHVLMQRPDMGVAYYLMDSGDVLAFPMTAFNDEVQMHRPHLNPADHPFKGTDLP